MIEWLFASVDPSRPHAVGFEAAWHGRFMVLGWAVLAPLAVLVARFYKVLPNQDWPRVVDNLLWWRVHLLGHLTVTAFSIIALWLILPARGEVVSVHGWIGYGVLACLFVQVMLGTFRGSKGGPTDVAKGRPLHGDHYDMTPRRIFFERCHKTLGYITLGIALAAIMAGLWHANAPRWMWLVIVVWWAMLSAWGTHLQKQGRAVDTYHAIWGDDPCHPGNCVPPKPKRLAGVGKRIKTRETHDIRRH